MHEVDFDSLPRETLLKLLKLYSRLFLALDGFWFLAAKEKYGYDAALELDIKAWDGYFPYEAKKIREAMDIKDTSIQGIVDTLKYSALVPCMVHEIPEVSEKKGIFALYGCPSLLAMEKAGYPPTCEPAGTVVFDKYAKAINSKAKARFLDGPPRKSPQDVSCKWEFAILEEDKNL